MALRREGMFVNHKRQRRLYHEEALNLRIKRPQRHQRRPPDRAHSCHSAERDLVDGFRFGCPV